MSEPSIIDPARERVGIDPRNARELRARDLAIRFAFGAITSAVAAAASIAFGARAGGIMLAFPAILAATVTLIEKEEAARDAREAARGAIVGSIALGAFAATGSALFAETPGAAVLAIATAAWTILAVGIYFAVWTPRRRH
jgi:4-amino-4-deoxy-L-arabinose transferase-like glycosyltransferase